VTATVTIRAVRPGPRIGPDIVGRSAEHPASGIYGGIWVGTDSPIHNVHGYRNDVLAGLQDLYIGVVRRPGGCFGDDYRWRDGIAGATRGHGRAEVDFERLFSSIAWKREKMAADTAPRAGCSDDLIAASIAAS